MLMTLTLVLNFINILQATFVPIFFHLKLTKFSREDPRKAQSYKKICSKNVDEIDTLLQPCRKTLAITADRATTRVDLFSSPGSTKMTSQLGIKKIG